MFLLEMHQGAKMAKPRKITKPLLHLSLFDWRVAMGIGLLFGIVIGTAPQMIGTLLLLGLIIGTITMVNRGRI
jgi:F0F1-type ATP synthase assembly protein I